MMKYLIIATAFLVSWNSFSQTEIVGKIKTEITEKYELNYALQLPANAKEKKPLIIFLHGSGEKGMILKK